jgi:hypothetical protein
MLPLVSTSGPRWEGWPWCMSPAQLRSLPLENAPPQEYGVQHGRQRGSLVADNVGRDLSCTGHQIGPPIGGLVQGPDRTGRGHRVRAAGLQAAPAGGGGARGGVKSALSFLSALKAEATVTGVLALQGQAQPLHPGWHSCQPAGTILSAATNNLHSPKQADQQELRPRGPTRRAAG